MGSMHHDGTPLSWVFVIGLSFAALTYAAGMVTVYRRGGWWPIERAVCWAGGLAAAAAALLGPLAAAAHHNFTAHMAGHLLLGMIAPLLLVLAAPITLVLRALPVRPARALSRVLRSGPLRLITHPVTAALLHAGGSWILYTTGLYGAMATNPWVNVAVHTHILLAGYLFTAAVIGVDPAPHRPGRMTQAAALIGFLAAHTILAKHLYGHPPAGVLAADAHTGSQLMYYGGDLIDAVVIVIFCRRWYRAASPDRSARATTPRISGIRPPRAPWRLPEDICPRTSQP